MNTNTTTFQKVTADPRLTIWENERHEKVLIAASGKQPIRASRLLLTPMIDGVVAANRAGKTTVEVPDTRGW